MVALLQDADRCNVRPPWTCIRTRFVLIQDADNYNTSARERDVCSHMIVPFDCEVAGRVQVSRQRGSPPSEPQSRAAYGVHKELAIAAQSSKHLLGHVSVWPLSAQILTFSASCQYLGLPDVSAATKFRHRDSNPGHSGESRKSKLARP